MIGKLFRKLYNNAAQRSTRCNICFSQTRPKAFTLAVKNKSPFYIKNPILEFVVCSWCGYSFAPKNFKDYTGSESKISKPQSVARVGDGKTPGREYFMAEDGAQILQKGNLSIAIFGVGLNKDHELIRKSSFAKECSIIDLKNFQNSEYFLPISATKTFDIVVACEVVEHFMNPRKQFADLFRYLKYDGVLIASTNVKSDNDISQFVYPFLYGHTSYYTGRSLIALASANNLYIDFRTPQYGMKVSKNKRYILYKEQKNVSKDSRTFLAYTLSIV